MKRFANRLLDRHEKGGRVPHRLLVWAFDYLMARGRPVDLDVRFRTRVTYCHPSIEVNPGPKTWSTGNSTVITFPLSSNNPYA